MIKTPEAFKGQLGDQTAKGGIVGLICYIAWKSGVDPEVVAIATPVMSAVLAWASTKIGDPQMASFFEVAKKVVEQVEKAEEKAAPKVAKKAPAKKKAPTKKPAAKKS